MLQVDPKEKALRCQKCEHTYCDTPCGIMDQMISACGNPNPDPNPNPNPNPSPSRNTNPNPNPNPNPNQDARALRCSLTAGRPSPTALTLFLTLNHSTPAP